MENGDSSNFKIELDKGFSVTGVFKLDHLQPIGPILLQKIFNFFTFILGGQFLLPKGANNGKRVMVSLGGKARLRHHTCLNSAAEV